MRDTVTDRQRAIARCVAEGMTRAEVAKAFGLSVNQVHSALERVRFAREDERNRRAG